MSLEPVYTKNLVMFELVSPQIFFIHFAVSKFASLPKDLLFATDTNIPGICTMH
jgi:hypothetical protein